MTSDKRTGVPANQDNGLVWEMTVNLLEKVYDKPLETLQNGHVRSRLLYQYPV